MSRTRDQRGATAVIVVILVVVLVSMAALVADLGALTQEKRELQNGADAAALAIAGNCATTAGCGTFAATGATFANANARDSQSNVDEICGTGPGMTACADPPTVPAGATYVRVKTSTQEASTGSTGITFKLAQLMGFSSQTVHTQAVAGWGWANGISGALPLTVSRCEFDAFTAAQDLDPTHLGQLLVTDPPYDVPGAWVWPYPDSTAGNTSAPLPPAYAERTFFFHTTDALGPACPAGPSGFDLPGGFGWLETSNGCNAYSSINGLFDDKTGRPAPTTCTIDLMKAMWGKVVYLPIFDYSNGLTGSNGQYHIWRHVPFLLTGFDIQGSYRKGSIYKSNPNANSSMCSFGLPGGDGSYSCITGMFLTPQPTTATGTIGTVNTGIVAVQMLG